MVLLQWQRKQPTVRVSPPAEFSSVGRNLAVGEVVSMRGEVCVHQYDCKVLSRDRVSGGGGGGVCLWCVTSRFIVATWLWPSYNGWHCNNRRCPQFVTLAACVAFVWDVDSRDQYGGGTCIIIVAVTIRLHLYA